MQKLYFCVCMFCKPGFDCIIFYSNYTNVMIAFAWHMSVSGNTDSEDLTEVYLLIVSGTLLIIIIRTRSLTSKLTQQAVK